MPQQPPPESNLYDSFAKNYQTAQAVMQLFALTALVWLRPNLGYRQISPARIGLVTGFLFVISVLASNGDPAHRLWGLLIFSILTFALGIYQRIQCGLKLGRKIKRHSYSLGSSRLHRLQCIPQFFREERRLERFFDPLICVLVGLAVLPLFRSLGAFLIFVGLCVRVTEFSLHEREKNLMLDLLDETLNAEEQSQNIEEFEVKSGWHKNEGTTGLPSGLGADLESNITISLKQRKSKTNNKNTIDI